MTHPSDSFDLVVIGGGSGGVRAARMAATYGARVAIVEEYRLGGTCVIRGCVPKKLFVYASRFNDLFEIAESFGWQVEASFDWPTLVANKDKEIARLEQSYRAGLDRAKVEIIKDRAVLQGEHQVRLVGSGRILEARTILVCTGARPYVPDIPGAGLGFTSNEAFHLEKLPHSIIIEGGGYVALEFASIFVGLGVHTTVAYRGSRILRGFDEDVRVTLEADMQARGVQFSYGCTIDSIEQDGGSGSDLIVNLSNGVTAPFGAVMFATGRLPNTAGLGLEAAGVTLGPKGEIVVDRFSQSSNPSIYAVGDVTGRAQVTPMAIREGWFFAEALYNNNPQWVDHSLLPTAVFAEPEAAVIGLTEAEAVERLGNVDVYLTRFRPMINTLSTRSERMLMKLVTAPDEGKVLGVHIVGPGAAEIIQMAAISLAMGATKADFDRAIAVHPTAAEELVTFKSPSHRIRGGTKL